MIIINMRWIAIAVTEEFERQLSLLMERRNLKTPTEAIHVALGETLERTKPQGANDFTAWLGSGLKAPLNSDRRFHSDDDLWRG